MTETFLLQPAVQFCAKIRARRSAAEMANFRQLLTARLLLPQSTTILRTTRD